MTGFLEIVKDRILFLEKQEEMIGRQLLALQNVVDTYADIDSHVGPEIITGDPGPMEVKIPQSYFDNQVKYHEPKNNNEVKEPKIRHYTSEEIHTMRRMNSERKTYKDIGAALNRNPISVHQKMKSLGIEKFTEQPGAKTVEPFDYADCLKMVWEDRLTTFEGHYQLDGHVVYRTRLATLTNRELEKMHQSHFKFPDEFFSENLAVGNG